MHQINDTNIWAIFFKVASIRICINTCFKIFISLSFALLSLTNNISLPNFHLLHSPCHRFTTTDHRRLAATASPLPTTTTFTTVVLFAWSEGLRVCACVVLCCPWTTTTATLLQPPPYLSSDHFTSPKHHHRTPYHVEARVCTYIRSFFFLLYFFLIKLLLLSIVN